MTDTRLLWTPVAVLAIVAASRVDLTRIFPELVEPVDDADARSEPSALERAAEPATDRTPIP
jgi:hypothetical protein